MNVFVLLKLKGFIEASPSTVNPSSLPALSGKDGPETVDIANILVGFGLLKSAGGAKGSCIWSGHLGKIVSSVHKSGHMFQCSEPLLSNNDEDSATA